MQHVVVIYWAMSTEPIWLGIIVWNSIRSSTNFLMQLKEGGLSGVTIVGIIPPVWPYTLVYFDSIWLTLFHVKFNTIPNQTCSSATYFLFAKPTHKPRMQQLPSKQNKTVFFCISWSIFWLNVFNSISQRKVLFLDREIQKLKRIHYWSSRLNWITWKRK